MRMKWKIGEVEIDNPFVLAPMAGVTDLPFRKLCKEQGAGLICMEMVSAKAISFHNKNTEALMEIDKCENPVSMQLFGSEPELMARVAAEIEERPFDILDINMGCPVPKVVNNGEGSALLKNPELIVKIVKSVSSAIKKPLTVKVRIGFENEPVDIVDIAKRVEDAGLFRNGRLGCHPQSKRSGIYSCNRKRRCGFSGKSRGAYKRNRMRRCDDRKSGKRKSVAFPGTEPLL